MIDPRNQFLLSMGANLMGQPYSPTPQGTFGGLGNAMNQGMGAFQNAMVLQQAQAKADAERKKAEIEQAALLKKQQEEAQMLQAYSVLIEKVPPDQRGYWHMRGQLDLKDALTDIQETLNPPAPERPIEINDLPADAALALWSIAGNQPGQSYTQEQIGKAIQATNTPAPERRDDDKERLIKTLMQRINPATGQPFTRKEAENEVLFVRQDINPVTGRVVRQDLLGGAVTEIPFANNLAPQPTPQKGATLFESADEATGLSSTPKAIVENFAALFGSEASQPATEARARFSNATQTLIRSLAENPKFPMGEMEAIKAELDIKPGMFTGEQTLETKMTELHGFLVQKVERLERDADDTSLDPADRADYRKAAKDIRAFLSVMGSPPEKETEYSRWKRERGLQ